MGRAPVPIDLPSIETLEALVANGTVKTFGQLFAVMRVRAEPTKSALRQRRYYRRKATSVSQASALTLRLLKINMLMGGQRQH